MLIDWLVFELRLYKFGVLSYDRKWCDTRDNAVVTSVIVAVRCARALLKCCCCRHCVLNEPLCVVV